jgi:hypothetical protein
MATKKKAPSKKGKLQDLPKPKKKLTSAQAKEVKGGFTISSQSRPVGAHAFTVSYAGDRPS